MKTPLIECVIFLIVFLAVALMIQVILRRQVSGRKVNKKIEKTTLVNKEDYYRELPCNGNLYIMFYTLTHDAKSHITVNFINAVIVKWYREKKVEIFPTEKEDNYIVKFRDGVKYDNKAEQMLYHTIMSFAGEDETLTRNDLITSLKFNLSTYQYFIDNIKIYLSDEFSKLNISEEKKHINGLIRFIEDFSMIPELSTNEVYLRDMYIVFSILTGCADKIKDEFDGFIPFKIGVFYRYINEMDNISSKIDDFVDGL